ncbi:hypothetical protein CDEST_09658 [Colletotrichum destructivum]|uniref:Uncharacterized protein n=1 Tax=Colletotrichum destructivum TaxID=34406 RepID=A0AAX4IMR0_9PEZI|nr:hypothetical protein CDEST_09658 [Colletotrichum destructivum]
MPVKVSKRNHKKREARVGLVELYFCLLGWQSLFVLPNCLIRPSDVRRRV